MVSVCAYAAALKLGVNLCASCLCVLVFLKNEDSGTFSQNKAVSVFVERTGSCLRIVITG